MSQSGHAARTSHRGTTIRRWVPAVITAAVLPTMVVLAVPAATAGGQGANYVSLGDSYVAGPLIPTQLSPLGCLKSSANYPHDTANGLGLNLTDMSCSGATTGNMNSPQNVTPGPANPAQLSAITSATQVVSMSIGGNDVGFSSIIENCAAWTPWGPTAVGQTCQGYYDANGVDQIGNAIIALAPKVAAILQQIHTQAPNAKVFVVGYPAILPSSGDGCWPSMPFEASDVKYLRTKEIQLDQMLKTQAAANGATYVDTYTPSKAYNACAPESTRWVEPLIPATSAAPVHPNAHGEAKMAALLEKAMKAQGIS